MKFTVQSSRYAWRLRIRAYAVGFGLLSALLMSVAIQENQYWPDSVVFFWGVLIFAGIEFLAADLLLDRLYPPTTKALLEKVEREFEHLEAQIKSCVRLVVASLKACRREKIDGTLHLKVKLYSGATTGTEDAFVQIAGYAGNEGRAKRWSFTSATEGVIGRCFRSKKTEYVNFSSQEEYSARMVSEFGFSIQKAKSHATSARSYCAHPICAETGDVIGVLYLFSTDAQVFPRALDEQVLLEASRTLLAYLQGGRYIG